MGEFTHIAAAVVLSLSVLLASGTAAQPVENTTENTTESIEETLIASGVSEDTTVSEPAVETAIPEPSEVPETDPSESVKTAETVHAEETVPDIAETDPSEDAGPSEEAYGYEDPDSALSKASGLYVAGCPAELFMLSIAGETAGAADPACTVCGDRGRAYGYCQFDYRYDLVKFMKYAFGKHPELWSGFEGYLGMKKGNTELVGNAGIRNTFLSALTNDFETAVDDQFTFLRSVYWDPIEDAFLEKGIDLSERNVAVSAAMFSVSVNCGPHAGLFAKRLTGDMSDKEMIDEIYRIRNTTLAEEDVLGVRKGTSSRYRKYEPQMAYDLLYGDITIDSEKTYGGGVEWHGNPFTEKVLTDLPTEFVNAQYVPDGDVSAPSSEKTLEELVEENREGVEEGWCVPVLEIEVCQ